jgi:hypothetical protein
MMILDLHRQGLSVTAIARRTAATRRPCANTSNSSLRSTGRGKSADRASSRPISTICGSASPPSPNSALQLIMTGGVPQELRLATDQEDPFPSLDRLAVAPLRSVHGWNHVSLTKFRVTARDDARAPEPIWLTFRLQGLS